MTIQFSIRMLLCLPLLFANAAYAQAEMVSIKWKPSVPVNWIPGNDYIDGFSENFLNGTVEEKRRIQRDGELAAELLVPKGTKGPIPFVVMLHGCTGMNKTLKTWSHEFGGRLVGAGYGVLILDSFGTRGLGPRGICDDPSQLEWARRRADDAYSALDWLIEGGKADPKRVYVLGASNGATTTMIIMNRKIGAFQRNKFAGAFPLQPSCAYIKYVEFYAPVYQFLGEKDTACRPDICADLAAQSRPIPVQTKIWKGAYHSFQYRGPIYLFKIAGNPHKMGYNAQAAEGTHKAILSILDSQNRQKSNALAR